MCKSTLGHLKPHAEQKWKRTVHIVKICHNLSKFVKLNCKLRDKTSWAHTPPFCLSLWHPFPLQLGHPIDHALSITTTSLKLSSTSPSSHSPLQHTHASRNDYSQHTPPLQLQFLYTYSLFTDMQPTPCTFQSQFPGILSLYSQLHRHPPLPLTIYPYTLGFVFKILPWNF